MSLASTTTRILCAATLLLAACNGPQNAENARAGGILGGAGPSKSDIGTALGAAGGAVIGSSFGKGNGRVVGGVLGGLVGAGIGHSIGASLDRADMTYYQQTQQRALETSLPGQSLPWNNPQTGHSGTVTPSAPYQNDAGQYCREYTEKVNVGGKIESAYGRACRQPDGSWQIVSQ